MVNRLGLSDSEVALTLWTATDAKSKGWDLQGLAGSREKLLRILSMADVLHAAEKSDQTSYKSRFAFG